MPAHTFTSTDWVPLGTGLSVAVVQASGANVQIAYSNSEAVGFDIPGSIPVSVPELPALGGTLFARSTTGQGNIRYATA